MIPFHCYAVLVIGDDVLADMRQLEREKNKEIESLHSDLSARDREIGNLQSQIASITESHEDRVRQLETKVCELLTTVEQEILRA